MKNRISIVQLRLAVFVSACLFFFHSEAQNITYMEYFFDTDPGTGNATQILLPLPADSITYNTSINTTGLQTGNHILFVRTKLSTGVWSLYEPREFFIKQPMVAAEYFFDADPGVGNGTPLPVTAAADSTMITSVVSTTGLFSVNHVLFVRAKDVSGHWSLYEPREFFIKQPMTAAEYFFDTDPGVGNGTLLPVIQGADSTLIISAVSTTGLFSGNHILFVRTKDASGHWSLYEPREFFIKQSMVAAEYFFDTDPGVGNGTLLPVIQGADSTLIISTVSTTGLLSGNHILFVRTKDASGHWSLYEAREIRIVQSIIAAEYFIDIDPGVGNAIPLTVSTPGNTVNINSTITVGALPYGSHYLFVRTKDDKGVWSLYEPKEFTVGSPLPVEWLSFEAVRKDDNAVLTWATASETNCEKFEIEKMIPDGQNNHEFIKIGEVAGNGTTSEQDEYGFTDENVKFNGTVYYRVKQIDFNGAFSYTQITSVNFDRSKTYFKLYPNPSTEFFRLDVTGNDEDIQSLEIINSNGQLVKSISNLSFPYRFGDDLTSGTFYVTVKKKSETIRFKIIKTK